jgi:NADH:ubiquinone oxidoreductase subunit H
MFFLVANFLIVKYVVLSLTMIILIFVAIAMFTLLERKILASIQRRRGPNITGF